MRKNKVTQLTIFQNLPELKELYLSENKLKNVQGMEQMPNL